MSYQENLRLSALERRTFRHMVNTHRALSPNSPVDAPYLARMARAAVEALTTGSGTGRRVQHTEHRVPSPGADPDSIRRLARKIEGSFHTMPNGWVSADDQLGAKYE